MDPSSSTTSSPRDVGPAQTRPLQRQPPQQSNPSHLLSQLLSPTDLLPSHTSIDLYSLRHLVLSSSGLPDQPSWLRSQGWKVLLGSLGTYKKEWPAQAKQKRREYYDLLEDVMPDFDGGGKEGEGEAIPGPSSSSSSSSSRYDALLMQIHLDLKRSRFSNSFSFFQQTIPASASCPLAPLPSGWVEAGATSRLQHDSSTRSPIAVQRSRKRHALSSRLRHLEQMSMSRPPDSPRTRLGKGRPTALPQRAASTLDSQPPPIVLSPPSPGHPLPNAAPSLAPPPLMSRTSSSAGSDDFHSAGEASDGDSQRPSSSNGASEAAANMTSKSAQGELHSDSDADRRSSCLERLLFLYALLNPSVGYVQGMVEVASVALWVMGSSTGLPTEEFASTGSLADLANGEPETNPHFEADAFWCFSLLLGELRELWDFEGLDHISAGLRISNPRRTESMRRGGREAASQSSTESQLHRQARRRNEEGGMARALRRLGGRLRWADEELWQRLYTYGVSPSKPYFAFRWLATLFSTSIPLPSVVKVWDVILCETSSGHSAQNQDAAPNGKVDYLIDVVTAILMSHRGPLLTLLDQAELKGKLEAEAYLESMEEVDDVEARSLTARLVAEESFSVCMAYLQDLPDDDIGPALELASMLRQKRVAAELTGEGAPPFDEEEWGVQDERLASNAASAASVMGQRAASAFREWAAARSTNGSVGPARAPPPSSSSATTKGGWLRSVSGRQNPPPRANSATFDPRTGEPTSGRTASSGSSSFFARLQSSDAAAELSKVGSNWQAKAMDRWAARQAQGAARSASASAAAASEEAYGRAPSPTSDDLPPNSISSRLGSFSSVGASFLRKQGRTISSSWNNENAEGSLSPSLGAAAGYQHPAVMQWNKENRSEMPDFPLPDLSNSPDGRTEYAYVRPTSMIYGPPHRSPSSRFRAGSSPSIHSPAMGGGGAESPILDRSVHRLGGVNPIAEETAFSSRNHAQTPVRTQQNGSSSSSSGSTKGSAGPKPLLLAGSARAAHPSEDNALHPTPPTSKIVRTGPLAGSGSPYASRGSGTFSSTASRRRQGGSFAGSQSSEGADDQSLSSLSQMRPSPQASPEREPVGGNVLTRPQDEDEQLLAETSQRGASPAASGSTRTSSATGGDRSGALSSSTSLQAALQTAGAVPNLPSLKAAAAAADAREHGRSTSVASTTSSVGGQGAGRRSASGVPGGQATISAGAFNPRSSATSSSTGPIGAENEPMGRPESVPKRPGFGEVSSSSDIPLVPTDGRQVRRRAVGAGAGSSNAGMGEQRVGVRYPHRRKSSGMTAASQTDQQENANDNVTMPNSSSDRTLRRGLARRSTATIDEPVPEAEEDREAVGHVAASDQQGRSDAEPSPRIVRKYTLVDEPVPSGGTSRSSAMASNVPSLSSPPPQAANVPEDVEDPPEFARVLRQSSETAPISANSSSSASSRAARASATASNGAGGIVRSKRSFKTGSSAGAGLRKSSGFDIPGRNGSLPPQDATDVSSRDSQVDGRSVYGRRGTGGQDRPPSMSDSSTFEPKGLDSPIPSSGPYGSDLAYRSRPSSNDYSYRAPAKEPVRPRTASHRAVSDHHRPSNFMASPEATDEPPTERLHGLGLDTGFASTGSGTVTSPDSTLAPYSGKSREDTTTNSQAYFDFTTPEGREKSLPPDSPNWDRTVDTEDSNDNSGFSSSLHYLNYTGYEDER